MRLVIAPVHAELPVEIRSPRLRALPWPALRVINGPVRPIRDGHFQPEAIGNGRQFLDGHTFTRVSAGPCTRIQTGWPRSPFVTAMPYVALPAFARFTP